VYIYINKSCFEGVSNTAAKRIFLFILTAVIKLSLFASCENIVDGVFFYLSKWEHTHTHI